MKDFNDKLPWLVTAIALVAFIYCIYQGSNYKHSAENLQKEMKISDVRRAQYDKLEKNYGHASNSFYTTKPIVVLQSGGNSDKISVYYDAPSGTAIYDKGTADLKLEWSPWNGDWCDCTITSGASVGNYTVIFKNKENAETFNVLVIVK